MALSKAGVEDATLDSSTFGDAERVRYQREAPGERILLLEALRARLANRGSDGRKRGTVITACKGYCFVRADGQPKKKGKDGYYCSFKDVEGRKSLVKGDRVAFEVVSCNPGSKHTHSSSRTSSSSPMMAHSSGAWAWDTSRPSSRASRSTRKHCRCSASRIWSRPGFQRTRLSSSWPPRPRRRAHPMESTSAPSRRPRGAVLRLMEENKRLRDASAGAESSSALVKENRRLRHEIAAEKSRKEEIAAKAAEAYQSERAANRCALEGLELMKRERENAVRALAEETAAHAETKRELHDRDEGADPRPCSSRRSSRTPCGIWRKSDRRTKRRGSS